MALRLAQELEFEIAAVAALCSTVPDADLFECSAPLSKVGVLIMNGTDDPHVPFENTVYGLRFWMDYDNVTTQPKYVRLPDDGWQNPELPWRNVWADGYIYDEFSPVTRNRLELYIIHKGGHSEPSISEQYPILNNYLEFTRGTQCHDFETAQVVWDFFRPQILLGVLLYHPISVQPFPESVRGEVSDLWVAERSGTSEGTYIIRDEEGFAALIGQFSIAGHWDVVKSIGALRLFVGCSTNVDSYRSLYVYRFEGDTPGWQQVYTTQQPVRGDVMLEHTMTHDLDGIRGPNNEIMIAVSSLSEEASSHMLAIDYMEIGVTRAGR